MFAFLGGLITGLALPAAFAAYVLYRALWRPRRRRIPGMVVLKLIGAVLLFALLRAFTPWVGGANWVDGLITIGLAVASVVVLFKAPIPGQTTRKLPNS